MPALFPTTPPPTQPPDWPRPRRLTWRSALFLLLAAGGLLGSQAALAASCSLFNETDPGLYTCEVDLGYTSLNYGVTGANGGGPVTGNRGMGAQITGTLSGLTPSQTLYIAVGGDGQNGTAAGVGSGGGGYSAISVGSATTDPLVVAGGGGGEGDHATGNAGAKGGDGGTTNAGGGGAGGNGGLPVAARVGGPGGNSLAAGGVGGTNLDDLSEVGGAGGGTGADGVDGSTSSGGGGGGFGGNGGKGAAPFPGLPTTLGGINGGGGGGYGAGGGGGGWGGGGGGASAGNNLIGGGGGGGGSSLVPVGAVAVVSTDAAGVIFTLPPPGPGPTVTAINPTTGPTTGNQPVTITGTDLTGAMLVTIGGANCTGVTVPSPTTLSCTTTAGPAGPASVLVTTPGGTNGPNALYTYVSPPTVTAIAPATGPLLGGQLVTITGADLTGATGVTIGGTGCTGVDVLSPTSLTCTTGAHAAGAASVLVSTIYGSNAPNTLYTYAAPPTVTAINPATGPTAGALPVTITGTDLTGATAVTIGGAACTGVSVVSPTSLTCTTPAGAAGPASVLVTTPSGTNGANALFTYQAVPTVTGIAPVSGPTAGGQPVTITGTALTGATAVTIGGAACTGVSVVSATSLTCTTGAHGPGLVDVSVTTPGGTGTGSSLYTYVALPTVTGINPASGPTTGRQDVTITGTNLNGATGVTIGGAPCTLVGVPSATSLTCTTSARRAGPASVLVTTPGGTNQANSFYTYADAAPTASVPIPTLSGWAQLILVSLLFGIAAWYRRTRA